MAAPREDIIHITVDIKDFYLSDLMNRIRSTYQEKCQLHMIDFTISEYKNKLMKADLDRTGEVVDNIMENAFKYGDGHKIRISLYEEEYCQLIRISNTGPCIVENDRNHIFDSFFRGVNSNGKKGNGLGLYICKEIMRKMDCDIFRSEERRVGKEC